LAIFDISNNNVGELVFDPGWSMAAVDNERYAPDQAIEALKNLNGDGDFTVGEAVESRHGGLKKWYSGTVDQVNGDGSYVVLYDDGDQEPEVRQYRIRRKGDEAASDYECNEEVDVRHGGGKKLYPGKIAQVNDDGTYDIEYADGDTEQTVAIEMIFGRFLKWYPGKIAAISADTYNICYDDGDTEENKHAASIRISGTEEKVLWKHIDGRERETKPEKQPIGAIVIADAISNMGAIKSLNLASNELGVEGAKIIAACLPKCT
jgi:hypothetical protein